MIKTVLGENKVGYMSGCNFALPNRAVTIPKLWVNLLKIKFQTARRPITDQRLFTSVLIYLLDLPDLVCWLKPKLNLYNPLQFNNTV